MEYKKFRVKTSLKSFRDLEIYKRTTALCAELYTLELPDCANIKQITAELDILRELSKKEHLLKIIRDYQIQRTKTINLKRVWSGDWRKAWKKK